MKNINPCLSFCLALILTIGCSSAPKDFLSPVPPNDTLVIGKFVRIESGKPIAWTKLHTIVIATWSVNCVFDMFGQKIHEGNRLDESGFIATKGTPGSGKTEIMSTCVWVGGQQRNEGKYKLGEISYTFGEKTVYVMPYIEARYPDSGTTPSFVDVDNEGKRTPEIIEEFKRRYPAYASHGDFIPLKLTK